MKKTLLMSMTLLTASMTSTTWGAGEVDFIPGGNGMTSSSDSSGLAVAISDTGPAVAMGHGTVIAVSDTGPAIAMGSGSSIGTRSGRGAEQTSFQPFSGTGHPLHEGKTHGVISPGGFVYTHIRNHPGDSDRPGFNILGVTDFKPNGGSAAFIGTGGRGYVSGPRASISTSGVKIERIGKDYDSNGNLVARHGSKHTTLPDGVSIGHIGNIYG